MYTAIQPYLDLVSVYMISTPQDVFHAIVKLALLFVVSTVAWVLPVGTAVAYHAGLALYANSPPALLNTVAVIILDPQLSAPETMAHLPLLDVSVKPEPEGAAVNVAHVPVVYHVPALMMQPSALPLVVTCSVPLPEKGVPGLLVPVGGLVVVVLVPVVLGRYLTPVAGQEDLLPSGLVGMNCPVCTEPLTS